MGDTSIDAVEAEGGGGWVRTVKDLGAGAAGGVAQVLLGESFCDLLCACFTVSFGLKGSLRFCVLVVRIRLLA